MNVVMKNGNSNSKQDYNMQICKKQTLKGN